MYLRAVRSVLVLGLVAVAVMSAATGAHAAFTKYYKFLNKTGVNQYSVRAVLNGLESVYYARAYPSSWDPGTSGYAVIGGVYSTTVTYDGSAVAPGAQVRIGWCTADSSCRLRDLRWGGGQGVVPYYVAGVPGGGMVFYDYPDPGCLTVVITNDLGTPDEVINLSEVDFAVAGYELTLEELADLSGAGFVQLRVAAIDDDIDAILDEIAYYDSQGLLPSPSGTSMAKKMQRAADYKHEGLEKYLAGNLDKALFAWDKAAHQVENFISQVTTLSDSGNLPVDLYDRWVVGGAGITPGPEIMEALLALPDGEALQSLTPLPTGTPLPAYPGLDPGGYVEWPVTELHPGEYTAFVLCSVDLGSGFIMGGSIADEGGNVVLEWLEQSVAEPAPVDADPPVITAATATPAYLWPPDHSMVEIALDVTVEDESYAIWYIADVSSNQPEDGTGDGDASPDWITDATDPQALWLRSERSGNDPTGVRLYTVTLLAIDTAGNLSEPYELVIPVDHDQG